MKQDLKNHGQGLNASPQVTQALKRHNTIAIAVNVTGSLIGALCVIFAIVVLFN